MKKLFSFVIVILLVSCNKKETDSKSCEADGRTKAKKFEMYEMSEMSALMEQMYTDNQRLKERLSKGEAVGEFPDHFLQIHKAAMTDDKENDEFFKQQAALFIKSQRLIYEDPANAKKHFNDGVNACLSCHQVKCGGPIPRIKKLYIK
ncbi:MAG: hypothetical protein EOO51_00685 [Flavobacterium sp.]|nr:MAG: hypothetical protein EOO51_00685 [Flavobacterium sp.]